MAEAYLVEEVSNFTTKYYADHLPSVHNPPPRYNVAENESNLSLFQGQLGSASGATNKMFKHEEWRTIMLYVLTNLDEVEPYMQEFFHQFWRLSREPTCAEANTLLRQGAGNGNPDFISWFKRKGLTDEDMNVELRQVSKGCNFRVRSFNGYDVNGYRFHTTSYEQNRPNRRTTNTGVFTPGHDGVEYYGRVKKVQHTIRAVLTSMIMRPDIRRLMVATLSTLSRLMLWPTRERRRRTSTTTRRTRPRRTAIRASIAASVHTQRWQRRFMAKTSIRGRATSMEKSS